MPRKCKHCKTPIQSAAKSTDIAGKKGFCGFDDMVAWAKEQGRKALDRHKAAEKRKARQLRQKASSDKKELDRNTLSWQHKQTQKSFNRMRVLEELSYFNRHGLEPVCISCGEGLGNDQWCCGHFKTRGAQSGLRYSRLNTKLQHNKRCNMALSGDIAGTKTTRGYTAGILDRYGQEVGKRVIDILGKRNKPVKWDCDQLERGRAIYNARIRKLERELGLWSLN